MTDHPLPGLEYHWWLVGRGGDPGEALCIAEGDNTIEEIKSRHPRRKMGITISRRVIQTPGVGCKQCLAWLNA